MKGEKAYNVSTWIKKEGEGENGDMKLEKKGNNLTKRDMERQALNVHSPFEPAGFLSTPTEARKGNDSHLGRL